MYVTWAIAQCLYNFSYFILLCSTCRRTIHFDDREPITAVLAHFRCTCAETAQFLLLIWNLLSTSFSATLISYNEYGNVGDLTKFRCFCHILVRMRKNSNFWMLAAILKSSLDSATPTSNINQKIRRSETIYSRFHHFFLRMRMP